ncbi:MAG: hypothetical protein R6W92_02455 [Desulfocurvibacter africanus]
MLQTTEMDLQELVRSLFEHLVDSINEDNADLASLVELVKEEEAVYIWFAGEDDRHKAARYTALVAWAKAEGALAFELQVDDAKPFTFFRMTPGQDLGRSLYVADLGSIDRASVKAMFDLLAAKGYLNDFFYQVRVTTAVTTG